MIVEIFKLLINSQLLALGRFFKKHRKIFQSTHLLTKNVQSTIKTVKHEPKLQLKLKTVKVKKSAKKLVLQATSNREKLPLKTKRLPSSLTVKNTLLKPTKRALQKSLLRKTS